MIPEARLLLHAAVAVGVWLALDGAGCRTGTADLAGWVALLALFVAELRR